MNVSKFTLSCRWLSSASFSVVSSSIPSPSAFSTDAASSSIQSSSMVLAAPASAQRLGRRRSSVEVQDAADSTPPLCHDTARRNQQLSRDQAEKHPVFAGRRVQPFKGTPRRAGCREGGAPKIPSSDYTTKQICCFAAYWVTVFLFFFLILMNLQFGAKTGNPHRLKETYQQISSSTKQHLSIPSESNNS